MASRLNYKQFDKNLIRDWTLYVLRLSGNHYYVGITARKDFMHRIHQHGDRSGAKVNQNREVEEIIEIQHLGKMRSATAQNIENDVTLQYRKKFGATKVRGGYDIYKNTSIIPTYTPGSIQSYILVLACILLAILFLLYITKG